MRELIKIGKEALSGGDEGGLSGGNEEYPPSCPPDKVGNQSHNILSLAPLRKGGADEVNVLSFPPPDKGGKGG